MTFLHAAVIFISCIVAQGPTDECFKSHLISAPKTQQVAGTVDDAELLKPVFSGDAVDVVLSAEAALVWDQQTNTILYEKNADERRQVASLNKLLAALTARDLADTNDVIEIPSVVTVAQRRGANVRLPIGHHVSVYDLLNAGLIASANDAMAALAVGIAGSEDSFAEMANGFASRNGIYQTRLSNATGLDGGEQYSTARDVKKIFQLAYRDKVLRNLLVSESGSLRTQEGTRRSYKSTNKLLGTYFPVLAAKTGYTPAAGENLVVMTYGDQGQRIGAVVLGSQARFQDMKVLAEWVKRNYTWP